MTNFNRKVVAMAFILMLICLIDPSGAIGQSSSANYKIKKDVVDQGGTASQSTNHKLVEAIGQTSPLGIATSANYKEASGFFAEATTPPMPILVVSPKTLNFGNMLSTMTFQISNGGSGTLTWSITETPDKSWLTSFTPASGTGNATVTVTVDRSLLTSNSDTGTLSVTSNGGNQTITVLISNIPSGGVPINPVAASPQSAGAEFWVDVVVGSNTDPVTNLFGVSFDVNFTNTVYIDIVTPHATNVLAGDFLGNDLVFFYNVDEIVGKVNVGISRKSGVGGVNGSGIVLKIKFKIDASTPNNTPIQLSISNVSANDPVGSNISLVPGSVTVIISDIIVWPGDTNNNGIVNQADILPIGLHWGKTGPPRTCHSNEMQWIAHTAMPWTPLNATYADANGDGTVNQAEINVIGLNWGKTHTGLFAGQLISSSFNLTMLDSAIVTLKCTGSTSPGQHFYVDVFVKNLKDLFGLSFELFYSPTSFIDSLKVEEGTGNILGNDLIFFPVVNLGSDTGKVSVGISRKFGQGGVTADSGFVTRINAKMRQTAVINKDSTLFWFKNILANDPNGDKIAFKTEKISWKLVTGTEQPTNIKEEIKAELPVEFILEQNYPNPFNPSTTIEFALPKSAFVTLKVYNLRGEEVATLVAEQRSAGIHRCNWNARGLASGVYLYRLETGDFVQVKKLILMR
jgi:hypothetical protein